MIRKLLIIATVVLFITIGVFFGVTFASEPIIPRQPAQERIPPFDERYPDYNPSSILSN